MLFSRHKSNHRGNQRQRMKKVHCDIYFPNVVWILSETIELSRGASPLNVLCDLNQKHVDSRKRKHRLMGGFFFEWAYTWLCTVLVDIDLQAISIQQIMKHLLALHAFLHLAMHCAG